MKTARRLTWTFRLFTAAASIAAPVGLAALAASALVACDDENDPKTWVKRLDDPAQRAKAIARLTSFYEDGMTKAGNNAQAPEIKALLDTIIEPLTKNYTTGGLDDKTRVDLMKFLAETHDARTQPALAKVLSTFEMGKNDDETRVACESVNAMAKAGVKIEPPVSDGLWTTFSKFQFSKATSQRLYQAIHDAILTVKDPSWGERAADKLKATVQENPSVDVQKDQLMWWQLTSVQILSELRYAKGIKPMIVALLTPSKTGALGASIQFALLKMAKDAEPELIKALNGSDPDYATPPPGTGKWDDKANLGVVARVLAILGRPAGRDAMLALLPNADTGTSRTELAQALPQMPSDPRNEQAFLDAYKKIPWDDTDGLLSGLAPRTALAQVSAKFYDPKLVDWLLKEMKGAPDYAARAVQLEAESKLMTTDKQDDVLVAFNALKKEMPADGFAQVQSMWDAVNAPLAKCKADVGCYVATLDEPIPSKPPTAYYKQVKATWMAVVYGGANPGTRGQLLSKVDKVKNAGARIALVEAIDHLAPQGDVAAADALDKIVAADTKSGDKDVISVDNTVAQVAWRLRVRAQ